MLFEHRRYTLSRGRMQELNEIMKLRLIPVPQSAGAKEVGYWTGEKGGEIIFVYLLGFNDGEHQKATWLKLGSDPEWQALKKRLGDNAPWSVIESLDLTPIEHSAIQKSGGKSSPSE